MKINYQKNFGEKTKSFDLQITKDQKCYIIQCLTENDIEMGCVSFRFFDDILWIYKLETNPKFYRQGVASAVMDIVELMAIKRGINKIEGRFFPSNDAARPFYEKNGYSVPNKTKSWDDYDPHWVIHKTLDAKAIKEKVAPNITLYEENTLTLK